jgi:O-antigen/teichoic acid export membrane protein
MQRSALVELVVKIATFLRTWYVVSAGFGFWGVVAVLPLSTLLYLAGKFLAVQPWMPTTLAPPDRTTLGWMLKISLPLGVVYVLNNIFFKIDHIVIYGVLGNSALGIYGVAYKVLEVSLFVGSYFASALKPSLSRSIHSNHAEVRSLLKLGTSVLLWLSLPIAVFASIYAREIILFLSNEQYVSGASALIVLSWTIPVIYLDMLLGEVLVAADARRTLVRISISMLIVNLAANLVFIPLFGIIGAAWVTLGSEILLCSINLLLVNKKTGIELDWRRLSGIAATAVALAAMASYLHSIGIGLILAAAIGAALYIIVSLGLGVIPIHQLRSQLRRSSPA